MERTGLVTLGGNPMTLVGDELRVGQQAPGFSVVDNDMNEVKLSDFPQKVLILASVPSLDTPVCEIETKNFNKKAGEMGNDVKILTLSMDLPFAQKRWCAAAGVEAVMTLSDHRDASFGLAYGVLIKELRLLARAIFVLDQNRNIRHMQLVKEIAHEPDYQAVEEAVKKLL